MGLIQRRCIEVNEGLVSVQPSDRNCCFTVMRPCTVYLPADPDGWAVNDTVLWYQQGAGPLRFVAGGRITSMFGHRCSFGRGIVVGVVVADFGPGGEAVHWRLFGQTRP